MLKILQHRCFPVKFVKFLRTTFSKEHLQWTLLSKETPTQVFTCGMCEIFKNFFWQNTSGGCFWMDTSLKKDCVITRINMTFWWFLACFKDIFDSRILLSEIVEERKHFLFAFDAIQFLLSKQYFWNTTIQNISNETSQKEHLFDSFKKKNSYIN